MMGEESAAAVSSISASAGDTPFDSLGEALRTGGATAALERLTEHLVASKDYRALLDALLLKARHELGLPLIFSGSLHELAEPAAASTKKSTSRRSGWWARSIWRAETSRPPGPTFGRSARASRSRRRSTSIGPRGKTNGWAL